MKIFALITACLLWLLFLALLKLNIKFSFQQKDFTSKVLLNFRVLFASFKVDINISQEMVFAGLDNLFKNITEDANKNGNKKNKDSKDANKDKKEKRYRKARKSVKEIVSHYLTSLPQFLQIKKKLSLFKKQFYRKINLKELDAQIVLGTDDAAETGIITGIIWTLFGQMTSRLNRMVTVQKSKIRYDVSPCFNLKTFSCRLYCIFNLQISHIIAIGYKLLVLVYKNRRTNRYGRTSN